MVLSMLVTAVGLGFADVRHETLSLYGGGWMTRPAVADAAPVWVAGLLGLAYGLWYSAVGTRDR